MVVSLVPQVKRCATHVYLAHYIHREQQISRHSLWSAAFCRSTPYNMNMSHVSMFDNEKLGGAYVDIMAKAPKQQVYLVFDFSNPISGTFGLPLFIFSVNLLHMDILLIKMLHLN